MLLSIVSVSTVCLALAYSGWDATDFPPGTDFPMTQDETFLQPQFDNLGLYGGRILKWLLFIDDDSDVHRECCGMIQTLTNDDRIMLQDDQLNDNNEVFIAETGTCQWTDFNPHDVAGENPSHIQEHLQSDPAHESLDNTVDSDGAKISRLVVDNVSDISLVNILRIKPVVINEILSFIWSLSSSNSRPPKDQSNHYSVTDNSTPWSRSASVFTNYLGHLQLQFLVYWSLTSDLSTTADKMPATKTTDHSCSEDHQFDGTNASDRDETNVDDSLTLMIMQLILAAIIHTFTGKRRLQLPKGTTITPVLYSRGKYLELALSKFFGHRPVHKSQVVFASSSCISNTVYNFDRPRLELTRSFSPEKGSLSDI